MRWLLPLLAGCSNLLGLSPPHEATDASVMHDAPVDAGPFTVHVVLGGTGTPGMVASADNAISCPGTCDATFPPGTQIALSATGGTGTFTGFHLGGCTGNSTCTISPTGDVTVYARWWGQGNIVFVTSTVQHPGSFDNVGNADALCQNLAMASGVPGTFHAFLPTSTDTTRARVIAQQVFLPSLWVRPDNGLFANTLDNVMAGDIHQPARLDELGNDVGDDAIVVTDTDATGAPGPGTHCQDWASESASGLVLAGEPAGGTGRWTAVSAIACNTDAHLYCLSNVDMRLTATPPPSGPIVWVSSGTVTGGAGIGAMDTLCFNDAQAAGFSAGPSNTALVTPGGGAPVKARFTGDFISGPPSRPDGEVLAPDTTTLLSGARFRAVPNVKSDKTFVDTDVWVGAGGFDNFADDCNGWTSNSSSLFGATRPAATTRDHTFFAQSSCDQAHHVLCMNYAAAMAVE